MPVPIDDCENCGGTGSESGETCPVCHGTGHEPMDRQNKKPLYIS
jgi:DnaJ-class molecular chaperone